MMEAAAHAIAEQLRLRLLLQEQKAIIEMLDEGVVVLEGDGTIRTLNNKAQAMLDLPPDAVHGNIQDIIFSSEPSSGRSSRKAANSAIRKRSPAQGRFAQLHAFAHPLGIGERPVLTPARDQKDRRIRRARHRGQGRLYFRSHCPVTRPPRRRSRRRARMAAQTM